MFLSFLLISVVLENETNVVRKDYSTEENLSRFIIVLLSFVIIK